jgi:hypothetical protein
MSTAPENCTSSSALLSTFQEYSEAITLPKMYAIHTYLLSASCLFSACYGTTLPVEHGNVRLRANAQPPVRESVLLDHLQATIGLSLVRTENLGNNKYQEYFVIEPSDYESAFSSLLAVSNTTLAETEFSKGVLGPAALEKRDILYSALCYDAGTLGSANVIGQIIPGICTGFSFGVGESRLCETCMSKQR